VINVPVCLFPGLAQQPSDTRYLWLLLLLLLFQVELATGEFPYKNCLNDFEMLAKILDEDPPLLPPQQGFSMDFCNFVCRWSVRRLFFQICDKLVVFGDGILHRK